MYGILFVRGKDHKRPLVIAQHGGLGTPEMCSGFFDSENYNDMTRRILQKGVNVFCPQLYLWDQQRFGRGTPDRTSLDNSLKHMGSSIAAVELDGLMKCIDWLSGLSWVDAERIGMIGLSYGGFYTLYLTALDKRIKAALYRPSVSSSSIHESFDAIPITQNYILQLHKILYSHMNNPLAGRTKITQNYITATYPDGHVETLFTPLAPYETPEALDRICEEYNRVIGNMELEPLIAIPVFIHDFLCIHPFNDGNGRMSRLLTTLLLYRSDFYVGKYISLEAKIAKNKELYYAALAQAQIGWHEGTEDVVPFINTKV